MLLSRFSCSPPLRRQPQPGRDMPVFNPQSEQPRRARRPRAIDGAQDAASSRRSAQKLIELPPTPTFMAVDRQIGGCEAPLTIVEYRSRSAARLQTSRKGNSACHAHQRFSSRSSAYAIFFATFLYLIVFVGDLPFVPLTVDAGRNAPRRATAVVIDVALIALFGLQHSVMARPGFKRAWTRIVPKPVERSVYVLAASIALMILFLVLAADRHDRVER